MHGAGQRAAAPACPPIAGPTSHVNGPALALGICFVPSAIVWFIFAYGAMTLNWLLPLNSFHLALPTLSTKPFKEMQLGKKKKKKKSKKKKNPFTTKCPSLSRQLCLGAVFPTLPRNRDAESVSAPLSPALQATGLPHGWAQSTPKPSPSAGLVPAREGPGAFPESPHGCKNVLLPSFHPKTPIALSASAVMQCCVLCRAHERGSVAHESSPPR